MLGEMPGDEEDKQGHPFVGPAGRAVHRGRTEDSEPPRSAAPPGSSTSPACARADGGESMTELERVQNYARNMAYVSKVISYVRMKDDPKRHQT